MNTFKIRQKLKNDKNVDTRFCSESSDLYICIGHKPYLVALIVLKNNGNMY